MLTRSPLLEFDWRMAMWRPYRQWPRPAGLLGVLVVAGQRGPTATVAAAWLGWRFRRSRDPRPLLVLLAALVLLNVSVGAVKLGTGRVGPDYAHAFGSPEFFRGGDMFPSGHTANSVVVWGTLAYLAPRRRGAAGVLAALAALVVGLTTVYQGYHWFSDALGGWIAGALVLLALPRCERFAERLTVWAGGLREWPRTAPVPWPAPVVTVTGGAPRPCVRGARCRAAPSPAGAALASHPRVWNERGPPRVPGMSLKIHSCSLLFGKWREPRDDAGRVGRGNVPRSSRGGAASRCSTTEIISGSACSDRGGPCGGPAGLA
ncbi:phosphatase PAP2 family protein [Streptomyces sp. NPDC000987]|uniref:phosphatase PAP2 family protein n=1 Tax=Streptomyces sp. NPDC000987 TaxID=3154374 RepID=UPI00331DB36F